MGVVLREGASTNPQAGVCVQVWRAGCERNKVAKFASRGTARAPPMPVEQTA